MWSFQAGGTKLERVLPKNQHTQRKLLNFSPLTQFSKFNNFLLVCWFLDKNLSDLYSLLENSTIRIPSHNVPYVPPILGQLLNLISPTKINIFEPRFDMANCLLRYNTSILKFIIFYCKKPKNGSVFFVSRTWETEYINEYVFPSMGPGSQVRVQVPEYGSRFPSTDFELFFWTFLQISLKLFYLSFLDYY